jgi:hypothetical protein
MSDKATLMRAATDAFTELEQAIEGLSEEAMSQVWLGTWGVREILVHISGWQREMIPALDGLARGESAPFPAGTYDDFDAWNARFVAARTGVKAADVLAELHGSHRDFMTAAGAVPDAHFAAGGSARDLFDNCAPGHYREHTAQIREWRRTADR